MDANHVQQRMQQIQNDQSFSSALGKILSGKSNYKPVIEKKQIIIRCRKCGMVQDENFKFCPECGTRIERPTQHH